jgi:translation initiation factor IF-2
MVEMSMYGRVSVMATGEGIPDLLSVLVGITQKLMTKALTYQTELEATVLEVKMVEGLGYTIDVILVNGELKEGIASLPHRPFIMLTYNITMVYMNR